MRKEQGAWRIEQSYRVSAYSFLPHASLTTVFVLCLNLGNIHLPLSDKKQAGFETVGFSCQCSVPVRSGDCNYFFNFSILLSFNASPRKAKAFSLASNRSSSLTILYRSNTERVR